jgi:hypothetical protein
VLQESRTRGGADRLSPSARLLTGENCHRQLMPDGADRPYPAARLHAIGPIRDREKAKEFTPVIGLCQVHHALAVDWAVLAHTKAVGSAGLQCRLR